MTESASDREKRRSLPGEEPACLQIAVGIIGLLLLAAASLLSRWRWSHATSVGALGLIAGTLLVAIAGFRGLKEHRQARAASLMLAADVLLSVSALTFLVVSFGGAFSWAFPFGSIFTTLAIFSDLAAFRFRRAVGRDPNLAAAGQAPE
jgi:hypothetical protein